MELKSVVLLLLVCFMQFTGIYSSNEYQECGTQTIRNFEDLYRLENCSAILGDLSIILRLSKSYNDSQIQELSFPKLG